MCELNDILTGPNVTVISSSKQLLAVLDFLSGFANVSKKGINLIWVAIKSYWFYY